MVGKSPAICLCSPIGYELSGLDVMDAYTHFIKAAEKLGLVENARMDVFSMAANTKQGSTFANALRVAMS